MDYKRFIGLLIPLLCFLIGITTTEGASSSDQATPGGEIEREVILTRDEKYAFDKFKRNVYPHLFRDDLRNDLFLLRWLRAKNLNVDVALKDMIGLKNFYNNNKIDTIADEDFSDLAPEYPFHMETVDREGRPVAYVYLREGWDLRAAMLQGKRLRLERYLIKSVFDLMLKLKDINRKNPNVTQFVVILNLDGLNLVQQGCPICIQTLSSLLIIYERFLPGFSHEIIIVEAPAAWKIFYQALRPALSSHTKDVLKVFDTNKAQWMEYIHSRIDPNQLPAYLGGTKKEET